MILLFGSGAGCDLSLQLSDICLAHNIKQLTGLALVYEFFGSAQNEFDKCSFRMAGTQPAQRLKCLKLMRRIVDGVGTRFALAQRRAV